MTVLIHGFWGQPADWRDVLERIPLGEGVLTPDLYEPGSLAPNHSLKEWTENFLNWLDKEAGLEPVKLVGYSMGARLALNALVARPERFQRALLLSGAAVVPVSSERAAWEREWSEKFMTNSWEDLEAAWDEQPVFRGSSALAPRRRSAALREMLGMSLTRWSPSLHPFRWEAIRALPATVEWAYGALDQKYVEVAKTLRELPVQGQITFIPNAGHRLTSDASDFVAGWIAREQ